MKLFFFRQKVMKRSVLALLLSLFAVCPAVFAAAPVVTITLPADASSYKYGDFISFVGIAVDDTDGDAIISYEWTSSLDGSLAATASFDTDDLASPLSIGVHTINLLATDAGGETGITSVTLTIVNNNPVAAITAPSNGASYDYGDAVTFNGTGTDIKDGNLTGSSLSWSSSLDGAIGSGISAVTSSLSSGTHLITLTATDSDGGTGTSSISVVINNTPPTASITGPADNSTHEFGSTITFTGTGIDPEEGNLSGASLVWTSSRGDAMGNGAACAVSSLTSGTHVITLTVTDSKGLTHTDSITITVGNAPPGAAITAPADGASFNYGDYITFSGTGSDSEDGNLSGASLVWTSSHTTPATQIGQGSTISVNTLPSGTHTITLTATDSNGAAATASISVKVNNAPPTATITSPADNSSHTFGSTVTFTGTGTDLEDGTLSGTSLAWRSDRDGVLGTGTSLAKASLSVGTHLITLTVTDSDGSASTASITIQVGDEPPTSVTIASPADGASFYLNDYINFQGSAGDNEDGSLTGASLVWTSSLAASPLGSGDSLLINSLGLGEHLITLTATDSNSASKQDFIIITVLNHDPVPLISKPVNGAVFTQGESITFQGSAGDIEDGSLFGSSLVWLSSLDQVVGSGVNFVGDKLSPGIHTITLKAKDSNGGIAETSVTITVQPSQGGLPLTLEHDRVTLPLDQTCRVEVSGGTPPYRIEEDFPDILDAELAGSTITLIPGAEGETTLRVYDHLNYEQVLTITVTTVAGDFPTVQAGPDQTVTQGETVTLDGSYSTSGSSEIASWAWSRVGGEIPVTLSDATSPKTTFVAPPAGEAPTLTFRLTITNQKGYESYDDITITVTDNGITSYPQGVTSFWSAEKKKPLGARVVGNGDFVLLQGSLKEFNNDPAGRPENMLYDLVDLKIKVETPGDSADLILYLPEALPAGYECYKYGANQGWYLFNGSIQYDSDRKKVYLSLMDGGPGDDDGVADGVISDPVTFGTAPLTDPDPGNPGGDADSSGGGGGGGGCFIMELLAE